MHRAIETRYKHRLFRSRLEARYAVLFDELKIKWDYEPEGFNLGAGLCYLPDFFLHCPEDSGVAKRWPGAGYWVEIKGKAPTEVEKNKLNRLCKQTGHSGYIFTGSPGEGRVFTCDRVDKHHTTLGVREDTGIPGTYMTGAWLLIHSFPFLLCSTIPPADFWATARRAIGRALSARFAGGGLA